MVLRGLRVHRFKKRTFFKELTSCLQTYELHGQREQNTPNQRQTKISHCPTETIYLQNQVEVRVARLAFFMPTFSNLAYFELVGSKNLLLAL